MWLQEMALLVVGRHMALPASEWMVVMPVQSTMQLLRHARLLLLIAVLFLLRCAAPSLGYFCIAFFYFMNGCLAESDAGLHAETAYLAIHC